MDIDFIQKIAGKQAAFRKRARTENPVFSKILDTTIGNTRYNHISGNREPGNTLPAPDKGAESVLLGTITKTHPTVSHLLMDHPEYQKSCWTIVHSEKNQHKPFTKIAEGTKIYINQSDWDLSWNQDVAKTRVQHRREPDSIQAEMQAEMQAVEYQPPRSDAFAEKFVDAIKQNLGTAYDRIDCYELVIQGLRKLGYRYGGDGGLKETLVRMATTKGEAINTYLSGEGLIEASGTAQFVKSIDHFSNDQEKADQIMREMLPVIQPGQILSFSTPSRGHTGIISNKGDQWTFINSGILDNNISRSTSKKGVGEESLPLEILNWVKMAARKKETLILTLGRLDEGKLERYKPIPWDV